MKIRSQQDFFKDDREYGPHRTSHGGELGRGLRKVDRPFKKNQAHHLVMKSSVAKAERSMLGPRFKLKIADIIEKFAKRFSITLHAEQNVGNHIHLMATSKRKQNLQNFLRTVAGMIARLITGARKGNPSNQKFWDEIAFSRVVHGRRDFQQLLNYIDKNRLEAEVDALARECVEHVEAAERKARRTGRDVDEFL